MATAERPMTVEEFLELPDVDGIERDLIRGVVRERVIPLEDRESTPGTSRGSSVTTRGYPHSVVVSEICHLLRLWSSGLPAPRGRVISGEAKVRLRGTTETYIGVDVGYLSPDLVAETPRLALFVDGVPDLAVEVLSPTDTYEGVTGKVLNFLDAGVPVVWVVDPVFETVTIHRPGTAPTLRNREETIEGIDALPGLAIRVVAIFEG